jgi:putative CocE/NonD family hydrolase
MMLKFFTQFLKEQNTGMMNHPRVRLEVRESGDQIKEVRYEEQWPPAGIVWKSLGLSNSSRFLYPVSNESPDADIPASFRLKNAAVEYTYRFTQDTEITGPARLSLFVSLAGIDDANLYAGIRKFRNGKEVGFEGTYGFPRDLVSKAALRVALRRINTELSRPESPEHDFDTMEPVAPGEIVKLDFQFSPSSTFYRAGDELRLVIQGRYFIDGKKIHQPFRYAGNNRGVCRIHSGPETNSELLLPFINRG